ncbi:hypothetical protein TcasGA2_TC004790 [Tribolium castaneum]|uniref:Uncharacterized protein n=1 Tax=Tribolium castaneum TaxID=7070 RepID=D6W850_TRICA|nr:hypothetical protein TcasGA2_TC004790 [Tribolium castaneum]
MSHVAKFEVKSPQNDQIESKKRSVRNLAKFSLVQCSGCDVVSHDSFLIQPHAILISFPQLGSRIRLRHCRVLETVLPTASEQFPQKMQAKTAVINENRPLFAK